MPLRRIVKLRFMWVISVRFAKLSKIFYNLKKDAIFKNFESTAMAQKLTDWTYFN